MFFLTISSILNIILFFIDALYMTLADALSALYSCITSGSLMAVVLKPRFLFSL